MDTKKSTLNSYLSHQKEYIDRYSKFPPRVQDIDRAFNLYSWDQKLSDLQILELWCCAGREYSYIRKYSENYIWVDIQNQTIDFAQNTYWNNKFICSNFEKIDFPVHQDIVFAFASLLHCNAKEMKTMLAKIYTCLSESWLAYISLKRADLYDTYTENNTGRVFYLYSLEVFESISSEYFSTIYAEENQHNNQDWITIVLSKK